MPITLLPSLLLAIFAVGYSPGPANLYSLAAYILWLAWKMWRFSGQNNTEGEASRLPSRTIVATIYS